MAIYPLIASRHMVGVDRRQVDINEFPLGVSRETAWAGWRTHGFSSFRTDILESAPSRPYVSDTAPFNTSVYPAGTVFVVLNGGASAPTTVRSVGVTTNPLSSAGSIPTLGVARRYGYMYRAVGVVAGSVGTITLKLNTAGTLLASITITADGTYEFAEISGTDTDTLKITSTWSGAVARFESIVLHPFYTASYFAVPGTLPAGYTARQSTDVFRGGTFRDRTHADQGQLRPGPHISFENLSVMMQNVSGTDTQKDSLAGVPSIGTSDVTTSGAGGAYNLWIGGALWRYDNLPFCVNGLYRTSISVALPDYTDPGIPFGFPGYIPPHTLAPSTAALSILGGTANWSVAITVTVATFTVEVWAGPLGTETLRSTGAYGPGTTTVSVTAVQPASVGDIVSVIVKLYPPGTYWTGTASVTMAVDSLADIPFPFSACGRNTSGTSLVAPGGYLPSKLLTPVSSRTNQWKALGVTTHSNTLREMVAFLPATDGWYRSLLGATPLTAIGEGAFDHDAKSTKSIDRGHVGRPFYSKVNGSAAPTTLTLTPYTPSPAATLATGTTHTLNDGSWWKWASIAAPSAGTWRITATCIDTAALTRGLRVGWSLTDPAVLTPTAEISFEPYDMLNLISETLRGTGNTPPSSPAAADAWIIDTAPTGTWANLAANTVVVWDAVANAWRPFVPKLGSYIDDFIGGSWRWYDGVAWKSAGDPVISFTVTTAGAQTISLVFGAISSEKTGTAGQVKVAWGLA